MSELLLSYNERELLDDWKDKVKLVDDYLRELVDSLRAPAELKEAISYVLFPGGKRIRPYLLLLSAQISQVNLDLPVRFKPFLPFAAAIELIHNYSLVHDDLPAMDNDDYRRGKLTPHKVYGEGKAILLGDEMLTLAFRIVSKVKDFPPDRVLRALEVLARKSGEEYLIGGQWEDIDLELSRKGAEKRGNIPLDTLKRVETAKTAGLIIASLQIPPLLLGATFKLLYKLTAYGYWLGQLFQITDDILDKDGYYLILGEEGSRELAKRFLERTVRAVSDLRSSQLLVSLAHFVYNRDH